MTVKKLQMKTIKITAKIQACLILCQGYIPEKRCANQNCANSV
jgi:hypothetical protein